jgi:hypothetical protein
MCIIKRSTSCCTMNAERSCRHFARGSDAHIARRHHALAACAAGTAGGPAGVRQPCMPGACREGPVISYYSAFSFTGKSRKRSITWLQLSSQTFHRLGCSAAGRPRCLPGTNDAYKLFHHRKLRPLLHTAASHWWLANRSAFWCRKEERMALRLLDEAAFCVAFMQRALADPKKRRQQASHTHSVCCSGCGWKQGAG